MDMREKWNDRYSHKSAAAEPARVLRENVHLLPASGQALDLACGRGGNAMLMARHGLQVDAIDISDVAIRGLNELTAEQGLSITARVQDVEQQPPAQNAYDVIVVSYFLCRPLMPSLVAALRPGGLLFYQTFTRSRLSQRGPSNDEFRLAEQELLQQFLALRLVVYREEGLLGDIHTGFRDEVMYIGCKSSVVQA